MPSNIKDSLTDAKWSRTILGLKEVNSMNTFVILRLSTGNSDPRSRWFPAKLESEGLSLVRQVRLHLNVTVLINRYSYFWRVCPSVHQADSQVHYCTDQSDFDSGNVHFLSNKCNSVPDFTNCTSLSTVAHFLTVPSSQSPFLYDFRFNFRFESWHCWNFLLKNYYKKKFHIICWNCALYGMWFG